MEIDPQKIRPLDTQVLVQLGNVEQQTKGGIILAEEYVQKQAHGQQVGTVLAVGDNAFRDWGDARRPKEGDRVLFERYSGQTGFADDEKNKVIYRLVADENITAVVDD